MPEDLPARFVAAFNARDEAALCALLTEDAEIHPLRSVVEAVVYHGHAGVRQWIDDLNEAWDELSIELEELELRPPGIQWVRGHIVGRGRESSVRTEATGYWITWIEGGRVRRMLTFTDEAAARAAYAEALAQPEALRAAFDAFVAIDQKSLPAWLAFAEEWWTDDIEMVEDPRWPGAGEFHGREEVARRFYEYFQAFDDGHAVLERVHGGGEELVLEMLFRSRGAGSGAPVEQRWAWHVKLRNGRTASIRPHLDIAEALEAAGIERS